MKSRYFSTNAPIAVESTETEIKIKYDELDIWLLTIALLALK